MIKMQRDSKEMNWALEGDIKGAYPNVNHKTLIKIMRKKIEDEKLLKLIKNGLRHNIEFKGNIEQNLVGTPQGGIVSPILFNIYMHEFDIEIYRKIEELLKINESEMRTKSGKLPKTYRKYKGRIEKSWNRIKLFNSRLESGKVWTENGYRIITPEMKIDIQNKIKKDIKSMRENKKLVLTSRAVKENSLLIRFAYVRYADDWLLLTNGPEEMVIQLKEYFTTWLKEKLQWTLDDRKTLITDLSKAKTKFLGYTIYKKKKRIIKKKFKNKIFRQRSTVPLTIGIDHDRVIERLIVGKILTEKTKKPRSMPIYMVLKSWRIVEKFKQRLEGLANYYHRIITYPSELNYYHYIYKFSCLKTLARKMNKSISQISKIYGIRMQIDYQETYMKNSGDINTIEKKSNFPTYREMMKRLKNRTEIANKEMYNRIRNSKNKRIYEEKIGYEDIIALESQIADPFSMDNVAVNLRSHYQLKSYCSICGKKSTPKNKIEMHHIKHVRKGKTSGFANIMKALNRKTIPTCQSCHKLIHAGKYDGYDIRSLHDPNIIEL